MKYFNKKFIILIFIALALFPFFLKPKPASAVVTTFETNPAVTGALGIISGSTTKSAIQQVLEWLFKTAIEALKRKLLNMMVDQIVNWIQGGGKPQFVSNWKQFLKDAADQAGGEFLNEISPALCQPFRFQLKAAFIPVSQFNRTVCTLSQVGVNINNFLNDFKTGSWVAWDEMVLKPQNNIYGAYLSIWDGRETAKYAARQAAESEAQAGKGFLSVKKCISKDGQRYNSCLSQGNDAATCEQVACAAWETQTPGSVVGDMASKAVGSDIDWLVNAQDLKAYVAAITNAALNRFLSEGLMKMRNTLYPPEDIGGGAANQCNELLGTPAYNDCITSAQGGSPIGMTLEESQKSDMISLIDQDLESQNNLLIAKKNTLDVQIKTVDILGKLIGCYSSGSAISTASTTAVLLQTQKNASTTNEQIITTQSRILSLEKQKDDIMAITPGLTPDTAKQLMDLWVKVTKEVQPTVTQSLATAEEKKSKLIQAEMEYYSKQLITCNNPGLVLRNLQEQLRLLQAKLDALLLIQKIQTDLQANVEVARAYLVTQVDSETLSAICYTIFGHGIAGLFRCDTDHDNISWFRYRILPYYSQEEIWQVLTIYIELVQANIKSLEDALAKVQETYAQMVTEPAKKSINLYKQIDDTKKQIQELEKQIAELKAQYPNAK